MNGRQGQSKPVQSEVLMRKSECTEPAKRKPLRHVAYALQRLVASARAGSFFGRFRKRARFAARGVDQDGIILLMPKEPSLAFYWVPLAVLFTLGGAALGALS